jgi:CubicO group peptidase (beta-lactamase class C family)
MSMVKDNDIMGLSVAIIKGHQVVYSNAFGYRDYARRLPMTTSSMMRIASISKTFTATSILLLRDRNLIDLD